MSTETALESWHDWARHGALAYCHQYHAGMWTTFVNVLDVQAWASNSLSCFMVQKSSDKLPSSGGGGARAAHQIILINEAKWNRMRPLCTFTRVYIMNMHYTHTAEKKTNRQHFLKCFTWITLQNRSTLVQLTVSGPWSVFVFCSNYINIY